MNIKIVRGIQSICRLGTFFLPFFNREHSHNLCNRGHNLHCAPHPQWSKIISVTYLVSSSQLHSKVSQYGVLSFFAFNSDLRNLNDKG